MNKTVLHYAESLNYKHMAFSALVTFSTAFVGFLAFTIDPSTITIENLNKDFLVSVAFGGVIAGGKAVIQQALKALASWWTRKKK